MDDHWTSTIADDAFLLWVPESLAFTHLPRCRRSGKQRPAGSVSSELPTFSLSHSTRAELIDERGRVQGYGSTP